MGVEPGSGDGCLFGDGLEVDGNPGVVHPAQSGNGTLLGRLGTATGGVDDVSGVVSPHQPPLRPSRVSSSRLVMIRSRLERTWRFISAKRVWSRSSAAVMILTTSVRCWRCWGKNSTVVRNMGQVRQALACGQAF